MFWRGSIWTAGREEDAELTQTAADDWPISRRSGTVVPPPHADELAIGHCRIDALRADGAIEAKCQHPGHERTTPYLPPGKPLDVATPAGL